MGKLSTALVTGANGALGQAVVDRFVREGIPVIGTAHRGKGADRPGLRWLALDLSDASQVEREIGGLLRSGTRIDAWIHCAGGFRFAMLEETSDEDFEFLFKAN